VHLTKANLERLQTLLRGHEEIVEEKRVRPEGILRQNDPFREQFSRVARSLIVPLLEEIKDVMVGKVESASIFHRSTAAGLKVKLDRWEDYERSLLFFGDEATQTVKITHEGIGFGLLADKIPLARLDAARIEEEAMRFLKRLFGQEQLRRPLAPAQENGTANGGNSGNSRRPAGAAVPAGFEFIRL
jgi:hypothetical protein